MSTLNLEHIKIQALCNLSVAQASVHGLMELHKTGHQITEYQTTGIDRLLVETMKLIDQLE